MLQVKLGSSKYSSVSGSKHFQPVAGGRSATAPTLAFISGTGFPPRTGTLHITPIHHSSPDLGMVGEGDYSHLYRKYSVDRKYSLD